MKKNYFCLLALSFCFLGCSDDPSLNDAGKVMGYKPVYASYEEVGKISFEGPRILKKPAKIYVKGNFLFISENNEGIHIINNIDPAKPNPVGFIKIMGNQDMEIKNDVLYVDNGVDLVALDMANPEAVKVLKRIEKVFPYSFYPEAQNVKFECPDESKGIVIRWDYVELDSPKCFR
jgi:hypothetical protein